MVSSSYLGVCIGQIYSVESDMNIGYLQKKSCCRADNLQYITTVNLKYPTPHASKSRIPRCVNWSETKADMASRVP